MNEAYFLARMRASLEMARNATGSAAKLVHFDLAGRYSVAAVMSSTIREARRTMSDKENFFAEQRQAVCPRLSD